jgi:hypothetical protein
MKILFSAYRIDQYSDPEGFKVNIGLVLEQYPLDTIRFVTDPRTGVQRRCNWPPSVKEVVDAGDQHMRDKATAHRFKNWGKSNDAMLEGLRDEKPTFEELKAKYGENWGIDSGEKRVGTEGGSATSWESINEQYHGDASAFQRLTAPPS